MEYKINVVWTTTKLTDNAIRNFFPLVYNNKLTNFDLPILLNTGRISMCVYKIKLFTIKKQWNQNVTRIYTHLGLHKERKRVETIKLSCHAMSLTSPNHDLSFWLCLPGCLVSILWPRRPCCCKRYMTTVVNTSTSFHLRVSKSPIGKKQHIYERKSHETKMADFNLRGVRQTGTQALELSGKMYAFLDPPRRKTTEYFRTKIILGRGGRRKLFNPDLMNKLIRMEWVSEWVRVIDWHPSAV